MKGSIKSLLNQIKLHPWKEQSYSLHGYIIQALIFSYSIYRYSSRSYESYGFLPEGSFSYPRAVLSIFYPLPLSHFSTFQFIYKYIPHINADQISIIQYIIILSSFLGLLGILPRFTGLISFLSAIHLEGILNSADAELSGGTILFISLLLISISPKNALYHIGRFRPINEKSGSSSFIIFGFSLVIGIWYFSAGLNKIIDSGINWPFTLNIHLLAASVLEKQFLFNQRISYPYFTTTQLSAILSIFSGVFTLLSELGSILFITKFRYKYIILFFIISMHTAVYFLAGINFTGNTILLLGILNWNSLIEKEVLIFDDKCNFCLSCINFIRKYIKPFNLKYVQLSKVKDGKFEFKKYGMRKDLSIRRAQKAIGLVSEKDVMYGYNTIANLLIRSPFFIFGLLMYIPPINLLGIVVYKFISDNRYLIAGSCDSGNCKI